MFYKIANLFLKNAVFYLLNEKLVSNVFLEFPPTKTLKSPGSASHFLLAV